LIFGNPSLTNYGNVNPAYRIFKLDYLTERIKDYDTIRLYL